MIVIAQIEHVDALAELDAILAVPGLTGVVIGANDLAGSLGHPGDPQHPDTLRAIDTILAAALRSGVFIGIGVGDDPQALSGWIAKGMQWLLVGADFTLLLSAADRAAAHIRNEGAGRAPRGDA
jgi:4-hydroxy-2-oxoheptanedioate aldolase